MLFRKILEREFLKNLRDAAATIRAIGLFAAPIVSGVALAYLTLIKPLVPQNIAITAGVAIIAITALSLWAIVGRRRLLPENAYEIVTQESTLLVEPVDGHHRYTLTKDLVIKANRRGIRLIDQRWYWTGQSRKPYKCQPLFEDHIVFDGIRPELNHWTRRWIYLGDALAKTETARAGIVLTIEDDLRAMRPFFAEGSNGYKTKSAKLILRFPQGSEPKLVEGRCWPGDTQRNDPSEPIPVVRNMSAAGDSVDYVVAVDAPKRNRRYGLRWQW